MGTIGQWEAVAAPEMRVSAIAVGATADGALQPWSTKKQDPGRLSSGGDRA